LETAPAGLRTRLDGPGGAVPTSVAERIHGFVAKLQRHGFSRRAVTAAAGEAAEHIARKGQQNDIWHVMLATARRIDCGAPHAHPESSFDLRPELEALLGDIPAPRTSRSETESGLLDSPVVQPKARRSSTALPPFKELLNLACCDEDWLNYGEEHLLRKVYDVLHRRRGWNPHDRRGKAQRRTDLVLIPDRLASVIRDEVQRFHGIRPTVSPQSVRRWIRELESFGLLGCTSRRQRGANRAFVCPWVTDGDPAATAAALRQCWDSLQQLRGNRPRCRVRQAIRHCRAERARGTGEAAADESRSATEHVVDLGGAGQLASESIATEAAARACTSAMSLTEPEDQRTEELNEQRQREGKLPSRRNATGASLQDPVISFKRQPLDITDEEKWEYVALAMEIGWMGNSVPLVQRLASTIHLHDLLADFRQATSPTAEIRNPGAWLRRTIERKQREGNYRLLPPPDRGRNRSARTRRRTSTQHVNRMPEE